MKMKSLWVVVLALAGSAVTGWGADEKRELLASHDTMAEFTGLKYVECMGLTAACPDRCGGSGNFATFRIVKYLAFETPKSANWPNLKLEKVDQRSVQVDTNWGELRVTEAQAKLIRSLKPGDRVHLAWRHEYVTSKTKGGGPEYPITTLEKQ